MSLTLIQQSFGQDSTKALPKVTVSEKKRQKVSLIDANAASPTYKIDANVLREIGALDIGQAIKQLPGVQIKDYGGAGGIRTVSYRSLGASHTAVLLDQNLQLNNQTGTINLSRFETFGLNQITFSSGQPNNLSNLASSYLPANTLNVESKLMQPDTCFQVEFQQNANTINTYETGLLVKLPIKKNGFIAAQGLAKYGSGEYPFKYTLTGSQEDFQRVNADLMNYKVRLGGGVLLKNGQITADAFMNMNDQLLPGAVILFGASNDQQLSNEDYRINVNWQHLFKEKWSISVASFWQNNQTIYHDPSFLNAQGFLRSEYDQSEFSGGFVVNHLLKRKSERLFLSADLTSSNLVSNEFEKHPNRLKIASVLGFSKWLGRVKLETNVAHQYIEDGNSEPGFPQVYYSKLSPYLGLSWLPFKKQPLHLRAFYKHAFRMPSFNDLYYNFIGNTNLKPETAQLTNLGVTYSQWYGNNDLANSEGLKVEMSLDGYYNYVRDKIVAIPTKDLFNWSMQNIGITEALGIEFAFMLQKSSPKWKYGLSTQQSFNKTVDITNEFSPTFGHQIPYTPKYTANYSGNLSYQGYQLDVNLLYSGYRYSLNENIPSNYLDDFIDINIGLQKEFVLKEKCRLGLNIKAMNILNNNYEIIRSFPMPGRYYQFTINFKYQ